MQQLTQPVPDAEKAHTLWNIGS